MQISHFLGHFSSKYKAHWVFYFALSLTGTWQILTIILKWRSTGKLKKKKNPCKINCKYCFYIFSLKTDFIYIYLSNLKFYINIKACQDMVFSQMLVQVHHNFKYPLIYKLICRYSYRYINFTQAEWNWDSCPVRILA